MSSAISFLYSYSSESRKRVRAGITYSFLNKLFDIAPELLIGVAVDLVVRKEQSLIADFGFESIESQLFILGFVTFLIWAFESFFQYLYSINWRNLAQYLQAKIRSDLFLHIQNLDMKWFESKEVGNIQTVVNDDINQLERFIDTGINEIIQILSSTILIGTVFFFLSPVLALGTVLPVPFILFGVYFFQKNIEPRYLKVRTKAGILGATIESVLSGIMVIKSYGAEKFMLDKVNSNSESYRKSNEEAIKLSAAFIPLIRIVILCGFLITLLLGGWMTLKGELPVGSYSAMVFLTQRFLWPFTYLGQVIDNYSRAKASTRRVMDILHTPYTIKNLENHKSLGKKLQGHVSFENVDFAYDGQPLLFSQLNLNLEAGKMAAFVGATGSGKSTLIKMLLRFYEPEAGTITIDKIPIKDLSIDQLRGSISLVSQDTILFPGTVLENIAFCHDRPDKDKVEAASKAAGAHDFIKSLSHGYETYVGGKGKKLSGGQRQRISIARALYKDSPVVIFDEATSSIDNETETFIQKSVEKLLRGRTIILIAHRLSTVRNADRIYVLNNARVMEEGKHFELIEKNGFYSKLWKLQIGQNTE
ncbi:MAG: ABC transporter [Zetaproteobacteria bacterium]|nr:ABC transporter [Pseudobdellovibrionaceae bacterium]